MEIFDPEQALARFIELHEKRDQEIDRRPDLQLRMRRGEAISQQNMVSSKEQNCFMQDNSRTKGENDGTARISLHECRRLLALDNNSHDARYEYLDGEVRMLAGGSTYHSALSSRLGAVLEQSLAKSQCWTYNSAIRLELSESYYVYPDLSVSCDKSDQTLDNSILHPCIVVEVLSPSTEATDTGEKLRAYLAHPTIQEYIIVDSLSIWIEVYHREDDGWKFQTYGPGSTVRLDYLNIQFAVDALYRGMDLQATRRQARRKKANS